jgi:hypothetical protein
MMRSIPYDDVNRAEHRIRTTAVLTAFWVWCGLLTFPMIGTTQDLAEVVHVFSTSRAVLICQAAGLALFSLVVCLSDFARMALALRRLQAAQLAILFIVYLSLALQLHDAEAAIFIGILYTCLLLLTAMVLSVLWTLDADDLARCLCVASVILSLFGIAAIAILGLPQGRNVGDIHPNLFAEPLLAAFIFSQFRAGMLGIAVRIVCFVMVALVSARFAIIGCILSIGMFELTFRPWGWRVSLLLIVSLMLSLFFWPQIAAIIALDDPTRDLSSGFSGRDEYWQASLAAIADHPFGIGFKRTIVDEAGHNGYLKTLLEFGIVGGGLIIFLMGCVLVLAGVESATHSGEDPQQRRFACARFAGLVALAFGAFFQPQLLNLGDAFGISVLFLLFKPRCPRSPIAHLFQS